MFIQAHDLYDPNIGDKVLALQLFREKVQHSQEKKAQSFSLKF